MKAVFSNPIALNVNHKDSKNFLLGYENLLSVLQKGNLKNLAFSTLKIKDGESFKRIRNFEFYEYEKIILMLRIYSKVYFIQRICYIFIKRLCYKDSSPLHKEYRTLFSSKATIQHIRTSLKTFFNYPEAINLMMQTLGNICAGKDFIYINKLAKRMMFVTLNHLGNEEVVCNCIFAMVNISKKGFEYITIINRNGGTRMALDLYTHSEKLKNYNGCASALDLLSLLLFDHTPMQFNLLHKTYKIVVDVIKKYQHTSTHIGILRGALSSLYVICTRYNVVSFWISVALPTYRLLFDLSFNSDVNDIVRECSFFPLKTVVLAVNKTSEKKLLVNKIMDKLIEDVWKESYERISIAAVTEIIDSEKETMRRYILEGDGWVDKIKANIKKKGKW